MIQHYEFNVYKAQLLIHNTQLQYVIHLMMKKKKKKKKKTKLEHEITDT